ncbi:hypothetical protein Q4511_02665 [Paracoccus sp. 1_MG-2023]|uniref:hypothetical protein n=1 Tax=unclassified Paracoccus (in: a-proteobacteria) TaxID=2688777 RepID=UPI001C0886B9|nr:MULTISPECIES: hypothetical protein [unclassified Paracoccus (in: a-proteobacteria)]MBU2956137.1 hypothetical protein [Paracoccus sp. C2R09]MDO6667813.1 hypothetical protein [Paracoccus sp. 1_MG-2023]
MIRAAAILIATASLATAQPDQAPAQADSSTELVIAVRADAPPFSYRPGDTLLPPGTSSGRLAGQGYAGYMVYICDRVLDEMEERGSLAGLDIRIVEITAANRFEKLRAQGVDDAVDVLCDPATVTRDRVREFTASLPLYMSGIGFAAQPREEIRQSPCPPQIGLVKSTTAFDQGLMRILDGNEWKNYREGLLKYMHNPTGWMASNPTCGLTAQPEPASAPEGSDDLGAIDAPPQPRSPPIMDFDDHQQVAEAFCAGRLQYYVGDLEIVNRALKLFGTCDFRPAATTYSDDRYVIFMRNPDDAEPVKAQLLMRFSRTLSELVLTRPSLLDAAFEANFEGYQPSDKLRLFFWSIYGP